ncbi:MAG: hypothetical protein JWN16_2302, partial [Alphaproteobacteria bacterium]|nr:hypothetical protein [Alphaproteobacteria bacterium]
FVAGIVGFGTDSDLFVAIPLGVFAGSFTALFLYYWDAKPAPRRRVVRQKSSYREPSPYREAWRDPREQQTWSEPNRDTWHEPRREFGKKVRPRPAEWR